MSLLIPKLCVWYLKPISICYALHSWLFQAIYHSILFQRFRNQREKKKNLNSHFLCFSTITNKFFTGFLTMQLPVLHSLYVKILSQTLAKELFFTATSTISNQFTNVSSLYCKQFLCSTIYTTILHSIPDKCDPLRSRYFLQIIKTSSMS